MRSVLWSFAIRFYRREFYFIPTIVHSWQDCPCMSIEVIWGNLSIGVYRNCLWPGQDIAIMVSEMRKQQEDTGEEKNAEEQP